MTRSTFAALLVTILAPGLTFGLVPDPAAPAESKSAADSPAPDSPASAAIEKGATGDAVVPAAEGDEPEAVPESVGKEPRKPGSTLQPPDGKWLKDAEGREYYVEKSAKTRAYKMIGEGRVRTLYGGEFDLEGEDEEFLFLKIYRPSDTPVARPPATRITTAAELAASAATFVAPLASVDRLQLKPFDQGLPTEGLWRNGFDLADMDGDGEIDVVHGPQRRGGDQPRVFRGDGHGSWTPYKVSVPRDILDYGDIKVADFNSDGKPDLAAAIHLRGMAVFVGDGQGKFSSWGSGLDFAYPRAGYDGTGFSSRRLEVVDWNKDGRPDLVALSEGPKLAVVASGKVQRVSGTDLDSTGYGPRVFINKGDGTWSVLPEAAGRSEIFGDDLAIADFDGNGKPDFLISTNAMGRSDLLYLQSKAAGGASNPVELSLRPRAYVNAVATGDFNRDRRVDFALTYTSFELGVNRVGIDLFLGQAGGTWERRPVFVREGRTGLSALDAGDVDGDKNPDLAATDHDGGLLLLLGDGKGGFVREDSPEAQEPRSNCRGYGLRLFDLDRDGKAEIVASYAGEGNALYDPERCKNKGGIAAWTPQLAK